MLIAREIVSDKIFDYLNSKISVAELANRALYAADEDFDENDTEVLMQTLMPLCFADVSDSLAPIDYRKMLATLDYAPSKKDTRC